MRMNAICFFSYYSIPPKMDDNKNNHRGDIVPAPGPISLFLFFLFALLQTTIPKN